MGDGGATASGFGLSSAAATGRERARCDVCPRRCSIPEGQLGTCGAREAKGGRVACTGSLPGAMPISSIALDPIEKKPISRFMPGSQVLSIGGFGCTMSCRFCQNHSIAMAQVPSDASLCRSDELVASAVALAERGCVGIAYTYNEPFVFLEFMLETMPMAHEAGLVNVVVTNGYVTEEAMSALLDHADVLNIDVKSFRPRAYEELGAPGGLEAVMRSVEMAAERAHVEVTTLVVPGLSDSPEDMEREARWLASIDPSITLHVTRFFPRHEMAGHETRPTDVSVMRELRDVALCHLENVELGNV